MPEANNNSPLLEIKDLVIEAGAPEDSFKIIDRVSLTLHRGEVMGLIGESGAGKSTLGLAAMGYTRDGCRITSGSIRFDGTELVEADAKTRQSILGQRISYVAQSAAASFNPAHKLIDQYAEGPLWHGLSDRATSQQEAINLYDKMQLPEPDTIGLRYPHQVSGGQLQRAMTAMSMSTHPDLIIFDEPTTALDVTTQIEVLEVIRALVRDQKMAAIYITHDLALVAQMADRIKILLQGEEVEEAETRQIMAAPQHDYTKSLWSVRQFQKQQTEDAQSDSSPLIQLDHVVAAYGKVQVLNDVSFSIVRGSTVAVVGESGSGKSTAARVITGLLPPKSGQVLFNGTPLPDRYEARDKDQLRYAQMIYQMADTALNPKQTIREILGRPVSFYLGLNGKEVEERVRQLLDLIEMEPDQFIDRLPSELSGGQKQRIGIARALAAEPQFIICDEVTSALDQLVAEGILRLLDRLQRKFNLTYMFITHDLATVKAIADEVVVMQGGRVVEQGKKDAMFTPPHHEYTELLLSSVPEMDPDWLDNLMHQRKNATK